MPTHPAPETARVVCLLRRLLVVLTVLSAAFAPALDLAGDALHPDHAVAISTAGQAAPEGDHGHDCGPVSACSIVAVDAPQGWQALRLTGCRQPVVQVHQSDLWQADPCAPIPIASI